MKRILIIMALLISASCEAQRLNILPVQDTLTDSVWVVITQKIGPNYFTYKVSLANLSSWVNQSVIGQNVSNHSLECFGDFAQQWHGHDLIWDSVGNFELEHLRQGFINMQKNTVFEWDNALTNAIVRVDEGSSSLKTVHLAGLSSAPVITKLAGAGTGATATILGDDLGGVITITTGTTPAASSSVASVTFNVAYSIIPRCIILTPAGVNSALLYSTASVWVEQSTVGIGGFVMNVGTTALNASTIYKWYYFVKQ